MRFERDELSRIVGQQANPPDSEVPQNLGADAVFALVGAESEVGVRIHGVEPLVLGGVGTQLVDEADAPALLVQVEQDSRALLSDPGERRIELGTAVAPHRAEDFTGETLAVDAHQDGRVRAGFSHLQNQVFRSVKGVLVGDGPERTEPRGENRRGQPANEGLGPEPVADQIGDADDRHSVLFRKGDEVREPRHRPVLLHHLADHRRGIEPRDSREVHPGLGLPGPLQDSAGTRAEREDMARTDEVGGAGLPLNRHLDRAGAVGSRNARGNPVSGLDRDAKRGFVHRSVLTNHERDVEFVETLAGHRHADEATPVRGHEIDRLRSDLLGGDRQITLVLAVFVIHHDDHPPGGDLANRPFDRPERRGLALSRVRHAHNTSSDPRGPRSETVSTTESSLRHGFSRGRRHLEPAPRRTSRGCRIPD